MNSTEKRTITLKKEVIEKIESFAEKDNRAFSNTVETLTMQGLGMLTIPNKITPVLYFAERVIESYKIDPWSSATDHAVRELMHQVNRAKIYLENEEKPDINLT